MPAKKETPQIPEWYDTLKKTYPNLPDTKKLKLFKTEDREKILNSAKALHENREKEEELEIRKVMLEDLKADIGKIPEMREQFKQKDEQFEKDVQAAMSAAKIPKSQVLKQKEFSKRLSQLMKNLSSIESLEKADKPNGLKADYEKDIAALEKAIVSKEGIDKIVNSISQQEKIAEKSMSMANRIRYQLTTKVPSYAKTFITKVTNRGKSTSGPSL